jgi:hypothetical protein
MKKLQPLLIFISFLMACSATKMVASWKEQGAAPKSYKKIAVVALTPTTANRASVEEAIVADLRAKGFKANATYNTFPMAAQINTIDMDRSVIEQKVRERVTSNGFDALLTLVLLDKTKEERYVEGSSISVGAPVYSYPYYGYYSYAYSTVYTSGYYTTSTSYFLETNLYDVATEKLIYTAQTKTEDPASIEKEAANLGKILVNDLTTKKVIAP